jgi:hypothetical protein
MAGAGIVGIHRRKNKGCTRRDPDAVPAEDLVQRNFNPSGPDRLWVMDVTEHPTQGKTVANSDHGSQFSDRKVRGTPINPV